MTTLLRRDIAGTPTFFENSSYHESSSATEARALHWAGANIWRWIAHDPTRSRSLPMAFSFGVSSSGPHDLTSFLILPERVAGGLFMPSIGGKCWWPHEVFHRITRGPSSLEDPGRNTTVQEFEDPHFSREFRSAFAEPLARLGTLAELREGWDSYGAEPIDERAIQNAVLFLGSLHARDPKITSPLVGPSPGGAVVLQWNRPDQEVFVEVGADSVEYYVAHPEEDEVREQGVVGTERLSDVLDTLAPLLR